MTELKIGYHTGTLTLSFKMVLFPGPRNKPVRISFGFEILNL